MIPFSILFYDAELDDGTEYVHGFLLATPDAIDLDKFYTKSAELEALYGTQDVVEADLGHGIELDSYEVERDSISGLMSVWHEWFATAGANPGPIKDISDALISNNADLVNCLS